MISTFDRLVEIEFKSAAIAAQLEELARLRERVRKAETLIAQTVVRPGSNNPELLRRRPESLRSVYQI